MAKELTVLIWGHEVGRLTCNSAGRVAFRYAEDWRSREDAVPLSLSMPLLLPEHSHRVVDAYLWGLLPENEVTLAHWGRQFSVSPRNAFALLAHTGEDCAGAVQFVREDRSEAIRTGLEEPVAWLTDAEIETRLRELREAGGSGRRPGDEGQFSLAGGQPKTALLQREGRFGVPRGRVPTTHILKPPIQGHAGHVENEHFCMTLASRLGLETAESEVRRFGAEIAIVVRRYDRPETQDQAAGRNEHEGTHHVLRLHQEDLCQASGLPPAKKYQSQGGPSAKAIVELLRTHSKEADEDVKRFLLALAYNWIVCGTDAHAKNYSLLIASRAAVRLAPLYDLASYLPYRREGGDPKLAMRIGNEYRLLGIGKPEWTDLLRPLQLPVNPMLERIADLASRAKAEVEGVAAAMRDAGIDHPIVGRLEEEIRARASLCRGLLAS